MKALYSTSLAGKKKTSHYHIVYLNDEQGIGSTSEANGHTHNVIFIPPQQEQLDEQGNVIVEAQSGGIYLEPNEMDGHTHEIIPYIASEPKRAQKDSETVGEITQLIKTALEYEGQSFDDLRKAEKCYIGEQWDATIKSTLESKSRAALTFNIIQKYIDELSGHQRKRRNDIKYLPMENGDERTANLYSFVGKQILEANGYHAEESEVFENMIIGGRGFFNIYVSTEKDIRGVPVVESFCNLDVLMGPHEKKDGSDAEYLIASKMYSIAKLKQLFGEEAEKISSDFQSYISLTDTPNPHISYSGDQYAFSENRVEAIISTNNQIFPMIDIAKKEIRLLECQRKEYIKFYVIVNTEEDFYFRAENWKKADIKAIESMEGFRVIENEEARIRIIKVAGNVVLDDRTTDYSNFTIIPVYAKKRGNRFWGKVLPAIDAQKEVNYRRSQSIDIANRISGGAGWFYDNDTFPENEKHKFMDKASEPGFVQEVNQLSKIPVRVDGGQFPAAIVQMLELGMRDISELLNINAEPNGANESGTMFMQRIEQRLRGNEYLFDNLAFGKKQVGAHLLRMILKYYTPERIFRMVSNERVMRELEQSGAPITEGYSIEEIRDILSNTDVADYDVVITESAYSPTMRTATLVLLSELAQTGAIQVPPEVFMELSDLPKETKDKLTMIYQQQQQAAQQEAETTKSMEMEKTAIAHLDKLKENGISLEQALPSLAQNFQRGQIDPNTGQPL